MRAFRFELDPSGFRQEGRFGPALGCDACQHDPRWRLVLLELQQYCDPGVQLVLFSCKHCPLFLILPFAIPIPKSVKYSGLC